jgi:hypothetical protein
MMTTGPYKKRSKANEVEVKVATDATSLVHWSMANRKLLGRMRTTRNEGSQVTPVDVKLHTILLLPDSLMSIRCVHYLWWCRGWDLFVPLSLKKISKMNIWFRVVSEICLSRFLILRVSWYFDSSRWFLHNTTHWACLDGGVSVSLKQTNTKTNTSHPNTCVSLVLVGTNTPKKLTPPRGGNWC